MPKCQPSLAAFETGFLKFGQLPETNVEDFEMKMRMIGASNGSGRSMIEIPVDQEEELTESDQSSGKSIAPVQSEHPLAGGGNGLDSKDQGKHDFFSQESFGDKSERS